MDLDGISADAAHRFRLVGDALRQHGQELSGSLTLLDVGGYPGTFARRFTTAYPRWKGTTLDRPQESLPDYVSASGASIPFPDGTFDAVVTIDTLEHVPAGERLAFLRELARVSKGLVVVAAPFHHPATAAVERLLNSAHRALFKVPHPWLGEHVENGLPGLGDTLGVWPGTHAPVEVKSSYPLRDWTTWQALSLVRRLKGDLDQAWKSWDLSTAGVPLPTTGPDDLAYRWIIVGRKGAPGGRVFHLGPGPEAGHDVLELARLYVRMLDVMMEAANPSVTTSPAPIFVEQRVTQALAAAEAEVARLEEKVARLEKEHRPGGGSTPSRRLLDFFRR